jgi:hypothetical protein
MSSSLPLDCTRKPGLLPPSSPREKQLSQTPLSITNNSSLSDILRTIGDEAINAVSALAKNDKPRMTFVSSNFVTGDLVTTTSSVVKIFTDRIEYFLNDHPKEGCVHMIMFFKHFVAYKDGQEYVKFKLAKEMKYFPSFYDPDNSRHWLSISTKGFYKASALITELVNRAR